MKWEIDELVRNVKEKNNNEENNCYIVQMKRKMEDK